MCSKNTIYLDNQSTPYVVYSVLHSDMSGGLWLIKRPVPSLYGLMIGWFFIRVPAVLYGSHFGVSVPVNAT